MQLPIQINGFTQLIQNILHIIKVLFFSFSFAIATQLHCEKPLQHNHRQHQHKNKTCNAQHNTHQRKTAAGLLHVQSAELRNYPEVSIVGVADHHGPGCSGAQQ